MPAVVLICFFLSGASGLILELLWTRMLTLVFGSTTLAISTVLTAFMGGLGLGSYLAGRLADRLRDPVRASALADAATGAYGLQVPWGTGCRGGCAGRRPPPARSTSSTPRPGPGGSWRRSPRPVLPWSSPPPRAGPCWPASPCRGPQR